MFKLGMCPLQRFRACAAPLFRRKGYHPLTQSVHRAFPSQVNHGSLLKRLIFNWAFRRKEYYMRQGYKHNKVGLLPCMSMSHPPITPTRR